MIDHFSINCSDVAAAATFYDTVLATLGHRRLMDFGVAIGYGTDKPDFWIGTFDGVGPNREVHIAFTAPDAEHVRAFHAAALGLGAEVAARAPALAGVPRAATTAPSCATPTATTSRPSATPATAAERALTDGSGSPQAEPTRPARRTSGGRMD